MKTKKMVRMLVQVPEHVKRRLDALRAQGYTTSGYIRHLLEKDFVARKTEEKTLSK